MRLALVKGTAAYRTLYTAAEYSPAPRHRHRHNRLIARLQSRPGRHPVEKQRARVFEYRP